MLLNISLFIITHVYYSMLFKQNKYLTKVCPVCFWDHNKLIVYTYFNIFGLQTIRKTSRVHVFTTDQSLHCHCEFLKIICILRQGWGVTEIQTGSWYLNRAGNGNIKVLISGALNQGQKLRLFYCWQPHPLFVCKLELQ